MVLRLRTQTGKPGRPPLVPAIVAEVVVMQSRENLQLRIVSIIEPSLCALCRFASSADVEMSDGSSRCMFHCKRRDCDNWQTKEGADHPVDIVEVP